MTRNYYTNVNGSLLSKEFICFALVCLSLVLESGDDTWQMPWPKFKGSLIKTEVEGTQCSPAGQSNMQHHNFTVTGLMLLYKEPFWEFR